MPLHLLEPQYFLCRQVAQPPGFLKVSLSASFVFLLPVLLGDCFWQFLLPLMKLYCFKKLFLTCYRLGKLTNKIVTIVMTVTKLKGNRP